MRTDKKYNSQNHKSSLRKNDKHSRRKGKQRIKNPLPKFLNWLKRKIESGDQQYALNAKNLILYKPYNPDYELIFILPEVLEHYHNMTGIPVDLITSELKKSLMISFAYTIVRNEKVIEVIPCKRFSP